MINLGGKETRIRIKKPAERVERMSGERVRDDHTALPEFSKGHRMIPDYRFEQGKVRNSHCRLSVEA